MRRVVVTGRGCISGLGVGADKLEDALRTGRTGLRPFTHPRGKLSMKVGAPVQDYDSATHFNPRELRQLDPFSQFALVAAREAVAQSGLVGSDRCACIVGSGMGGQGSINDMCEGLYDGGRSPPPLTVPRAMVSAATSQVAMAFGITGPAFATSSACATASHAIGLAFQMIRAGMVDAALAGGAEFVYSYGHLRAWDSLRVVSPDTCRPFCRDRTGVILGEGAGILALETLENAERRGVPILAELVGFGQSSDAKDLILPSPEGMAAAIAACLSDARLSPEDVDHVNAHGTGTKANDAAETKALHLAFGKRHGNIAVTSTKSIHGHGLGASPAFEAIASILALREGFVPPTCNVTELDPECDIDLVCHAPRRKALQTAISNSFGFGGVNAVLAFRRWNQSVAP